MDVHQQALLDDTNEYQLVALESILLNKIKVEEAYNKHLKLKHLVKAIWFGSLSCR